MFYAINDNFLKLYKSNCQCYFESKQHHTVKRIENIWKFGFRIYLILFDYIILLKQSEYVAHSSWVVFFKSRENQIFYWPPRPRSGDYNVLFFQYYWISANQKEAKFSHIIPVILPTLHPIFFHGAVYIHYLLRMVLLLY